MFFSNTVAATKETPNPGLVQQVRDAYRELIYVGDGVKQANGHLKLVKLGNENSDSGLKLTAFLIALDQGVGRGMEEHKHVLKEIFKDVDDAVLTYAFERLNELNIPLHRTMAYCLPDRDVRYQILAQHKYERSVTKPDSLAWAAGLQRDDEKIKKLAEKTPVASGFVIEELMQVLKGEKDIDTCSRRMAFDDPPSFSDNAEKALKIRLSSSVAVWALEEELCKGRYGNTAETLMACMQENHSNPAFNKPVAQTMCKIISGFKEHPSIKAKADDLLLILSAKSEADEAKVVHRKSSFSKTLFAS